MESKYVEKYLVMFHETRQGIENLMNKVSFEGYSLVSFHPSITGYTVIMGLD